VDPDGANRLSLVVALDNAAAVSDPLPLASLRLHPVVALELLRRTGKVRLQRRPHGAEVVGVDPLFPPREIEGDLRPIVAQHAGPPLVEPHLIGADVPVPHARIGALDGEPEPLGEFAEFALALLLLGHVAEVHREAGVGGIRVDREIEIRAGEVELEGGRFPGSHRVAELLLQFGPAKSPEPVPDLVAEQVLGVAWEQLCRPLC